MYYTYVLLSSKDGRWYTGAASDLGMRLNEHETGKVPSTRCRRPLRLIYYECRSNSIRVATTPIRAGKLERHEACPHADDAYRRERYLKTGRGKRYLHQRLKASWSRLRQEKLERH